MKKLLWAAMAMLVAGAAQSAVISLTGANAENATASVGTLATVTEPADGTEITSISYTVSGLTIDNDGADNDTVTFTFAVSATGTGTINWDVNTVSEFKYNNSAFNVAGEGITFSDITVSGTSSGGLDYQLDSAAFTEFTARRWHDGDAYSIDGDVTDTTRAWATGESLGAVALNDTSFTAAWSAGSWNALDVDFTADVSAVPEPATIGMLGLGAFLTLVLRRKLHA